MFNCYAHGWSHLEKMCPMCVSINSITTSWNELKYNAFDRLAVVSKTDYDNIAAENAELKLKYDLLMADAKELITASSRVKHFKEGVAWERKRSEARIKELEAKLKIAVSALKYYASEEAKIIEVKERMSLTGESLSREYIFGIENKAAREALKQIEEVEAGK